MCSRNIIHTDRNHSMIEKSSELEAVTLVWFLVQTKWKHENSSQKCVGIDIWNREKMNMVLFPWIFPHLSRIILQLLQVDIVPFQKVMSNVYSECIHQVVVRFLCSSWMPHTVFYVHVFLWCLPDLTQPMLRLIQTKARSVAKHQSMSWECLAKVTWN